MMHIFNRKHRGETIIEVLVATLIFAIVVVSTFVAISHAFSSSSNIHHRLQALNMAREGIEAVRNIRDTNWLKYSGDRRGKWMCIDTASTDCGATLGTDPTYFTIDYDGTNQRYYLEKMDGAASATLDVEGTLDDFAPYQLYWDDTNSRTTHASTGNDPLIFYRQIELEEELNYACSGNQCDEKRAHVVSRVQWFDGRAPRSITLETYLYDFYARNSYDD